jgi:hypothetical protein
VTRLSDFSPLCDWFKKYIRSTNFLLLFPFIKSHVFILRKNWLGYILGDFFTNSPGHSAKQGCLATDFFTFLHCTENI